MANIVEIIMRARDQGFEKVDGLGAKFRSLAKFGAVAGTAVAAGLTAAVAAAVHLTNQTAKLGDEIAKMARRTGLSTEALSELSHAANLSGSSLQDLENGIRRLQRNITDADAGLTTSIRAFDRLGISWRDTNGRLKEADQLLPEVADAFGRLGSDTERAATAQELFGRAGTQLIPLLAAGSAGIKDMREEARRLGLTFTADAAKAAEDYIDSQERLRASIRGVRNVIGIELMPVITEITERTSTWIAENRDLLAQDIKGFLEGAVTVGTRFVSIMKDAVEFTARLVFLTSEEGKEQARVGAIMEERARLLERQKEIEERMEGVRSRGTGTRGMSRKDVDEPTGAALRRGLEQQLAQVKAEILRLGEEEAALIESINERLRSRLRTTEDPRDAEGETFTAMSEEAQRAFQMRLEMLTRIRDAQHKAALDAVQDERNAAGVVAEINTEREKSTISLIERVQAAIHISAESVSRDFGDTFADAVVRGSRRADEAWSAFFQNIEARIAALVASAAFQAFIALITGGNPIAAFASNFGGILGVPGGSGPAPSGGSLEFASQQSVTLQIDGRDLVTSAGRVMTRRVVTSRPGRF